MFNLLNCQWPYIIGYAMFLVVLNIGNVIHLHNAGCLKPFRERDQLIGMLVFVLSLMGILALVDWVITLWFLAFPSVVFHGLFLYYGGGLRRC